MKTRLASLLGPRGAAALYRAFLDDAVAALGEVPGVRSELWVWSPRGDAEARARAHRALARRYPGVPVRWQSGGDLGERLHAAFATAFREETEAAVALGSDHPTLPVSCIREAFARLERRDVTLGPSADGGYYAIGIRRGVWPRAGRLFRDVPWSSGDVYGWTRRRARDLGLFVAGLPEWYDVDTPEDLARLRTDVREGSRTARALAAAEARSSAGRGRAASGAPGSARRAEPDA